MSTIKTPEYKAAEGYTWGNRQDGLRYRILPENLDRIYPFQTEIEVVPGVTVPASIGYQPSCIAASKADPGRFFVGHYYAPAIKMISISPPQDGGLELKHEGVVAWTKTAWGTDCRGGFPENAPGSDAKRMQCIVPHPDKHKFLVARNGEVDGFWVIHPHDTNGKIKWTVVSYLRLQGVHERDHFIESAIIMPGDTIYVLRSRQNGTPAWIEVYDLEGEQIDVVKSDLPPETPFLYGIGYHGADPVPYYITGLWQDLKVEPGIYRGKELVVPGVCGNGIAFDASGNAYVAQYADGRGHQATPGHIIRVPARMFVK